MRAASPGPLPRRLRRPTLLIVGCGDVGLRLIRILRSAHSARLRVIATARRGDQLEAIRTAGGIPLACNLDDRQSVRRLAGLGRWVVHLAPPPNEGGDDPRTRRLAAACARSALRTSQGTGVTRWAYVSTTGVYGDRQGAWIDETSAPAPVNARAKRRIAAEGELRRFGRATGARVSLLRAPGIYAQDRLPHERLRQGLPALREEEDVFTNHIHADELARACWLALWRGGGGRAYNICDDTQLKMGDYFDVVADALQLPRPPRLTREALTARVSPMMLSFMSESRRLHNRRMKHELRMTLRVADVHDLLALL